MSLIAAIANTIQRKHSAKFQCSGERYKTKLFYYADQFVVEIFCDTGFKYFQYSTGNIFHMDDCEFSALQHKK